ncbi:MAG: quaternary ammonium compound efflux SMR transporter SugE [Burkholderiaceae bacterium]
MALSVSQAWLLLLLAGALEIVWALGLKYSDGFSRLWPSVVVVVAAAASFWLLALAMRVLPAGTAYAVWTGIGAAGTALLGIWLLGEPATALRLACIGLIVAGVLGLKFVAGH